MKLVFKRGPVKTICPSEAARAVNSDNWRSLMDGTQEAAADLKSQNKIIIEQGGKPVDLETADGPIRLRLKED